MGQSKHWIASGTQSSHRVIFDTAASCDKDIQVCLASIMAALAWATTLDDHALLVGLAGSLPCAVLEEQLRLYEASQPIVAKPSKAPEQLLVHAHLHSSRMQAASEFGKYLRDGGWMPGDRLPRN